MNSTWQVFSLGLLEQLMKFSLKRAAITMMGTGVITALVNITWGMKSTFLISSKLNYFLGQLWASHFPKDFGN